MTTPILLTIVIFTLVSAIVYFCSPKHDPNNFDRLKSNV